MIIRWIFSTVFFCLISSPVYALNNPFEKKEVIDIGSDVSWQIKDDSAIKTVKGKRGRYFQLIFNKTQLQLAITKDAAGRHAEHFSQLAIMDMRIDGEQQPLFRWCLLHQERQNRFLQQGLEVKGDICLVGGDQGMFTINLDQTMLAALKRGRHLVLLIRPYRTTIKLNYDLSDFNSMTTALLRKSEPAVKKVAITIPQAATVKSVKKQKKCWAGPPAKYTKIKAVEYVCDDIVAKKEAKSRISQLVSKERAKQEKQKSLQERKKQELETQRKKEDIARKHEQQRQSETEAAAIAASKVKQSEISNEITTKMVGLCEKLWDKGEHRCYCQKYIKFAPANIRALSTCK